MLGTTTRVVIGAIGTLIALAGLTLVAMGEGVIGGGLWITILGAAMVVAVVVERQRYRSEAHDRTFDPVGPGGGEPPGSLEPRFQRTEEVFVDPTSGERMRVHLDPRTGERRYVAEP
ncbi:MAG TPA: hypothetical protein VFV72_16655 [Candidatus Limnocylindrales bacterium]|nr:hypothetical protein [Candidatus Limnocylindrales bacterium]